MISGHATSIHFLDTLFVPVPAIWGPSYVLSGEHSYRFDGNTLRIWKEKNVGSVHYELKLVKYLITSILNQAAKLGAYSSQSLEPLFS